MCIPVSLINSQNLNTCKLSQYNTVILADGSYGNLDSTDINALKDWIRNGGTLISTQSGSRWVVNKKIVNEKIKKRGNQSLDIPYDQVRRVTGGQRIGGAIFEVDLDNTHPIGYGYNKKIQFSTEDRRDLPIALYGATKKSNELLAHAYSNIYGLPTTGLRFFTVYGPWGRPDMALFLFTKAILADEPIKVFNYGKHRRDFTYIDDIVEGIIRTLDKPASPKLEWNSEQPDPATSNAPWRIYNIGNNQPVELMDYIAALEQALGKKAEKEFLPLQTGDVHETYANVDDLAEQFDYKPETPVEDGIGRFVSWYRDSFKV